MPLSQLNNLLKEGPVKMSKYCDIVLEGGVEYHGIIYLFDKTDFSDYMPVDMCMYNVIPLCMYNVIP